MSESPRVSPNRFHGPKATHPFPPPRWPLIQTATTANQFHHLLYRLLRPWPVRVPHQPSLPELHSVPLRLPQEPLPRTQPLPSPTTPKSSDTDPTPSLVPKVCCEVSTRLRMPPFSDTVLRLMIFLQPEIGDLRTPLCLRIGGAPGV